MKHSITPRRAIVEGNSKLRRKEAFFCSSSQHRLSRNRLASCATLVCLALLVAVYPRAVEGSKGSQTKSEGVQIQGVEVKATASAVINFDDVARQVALNPPVSVPLPKAITPPHRIDEVDAGKGEPPSQAAPVNVPRPSVPSPSPAINYAGLDDIAQVGLGFFTIPPDTTGAVGSDAVNKVFGTLNNNYRVQNKTTGATIGSDVSMPAFWAASLANDPFDPRVLYDPFNDRWIAAAVSDAGNSTTSILVGISLTNDPSGAFALFKVSARVAGDNPTVNFADFPMLGFNKNWVVVSINMFTMVGNFVDGRSLVLDYPMLRSGVLSGTYFTGVTAANAGFCMHPATTYSATENTEYLVAHLSSAGATYKMHTITGTPAAPVFTVGATKTRPGGGWAQPSGNILPQAMGTCSTTPMNMDVGDAYIRNNVVFRNGSIWYSQTVGLPAGGLTHSAAQWTQLDTAGNVVQGGRVDDPTATSTNGGKWYAYPSIAVNAANDVLLGFSEFSSAQFASSGYTYRDHLDALGTMRDPLIFKAGEDCYSKDFSSGSNRWGDYSHTMVDPTGDSSFWTVQEYAKLQAPPTVGGSTSKWGTWWAKVNPVMPTAAKVKTFTADGFDDGRVLLRWSTSHEVDNLGYNVYRETQGRRAKINPQTIAGSALMTGPRVALTAGQSYAWSDQLVEAETRFWLEDIDLSGKSNWTGPITLNARGGKAPRTEESAILTSVGLASAQMSLGQGSTQVDRKAENPGLTPAAIKLQSDLAGRPAVKVGVSREGWYRISQQDLVDAGLSPSVNARNLQLYVDGHQVPIIVNGEQDGKLDPSDSIEFYGVGLDSAATSTHVYWLVAGGQSGARIKSTKTGAGQSGSGSFVTAVERKDRTLYFAGLRNGETENFFGPVVAGTSVDQSLTLTNLAQTSTPATLEVDLQGVTLTPHQTEVKFNGAVIGSVSFKGQEQGKASFQIAPSQLREGVNSVQLISLGGASDISLVDTVRVSYAHAFTADSDQLGARVKGGQAVTIGGFSSSDIRVIDVTDSSDPQELIGTIIGSKGKIGVTVRAPGSGTRSLLAFTDSRAISAPAKPNLPSNWRGGGLEYDYLMITTAEIKESLGPLKALRESQGLSVAVVDVEDIYDEFSFGNKSPQAIKDFLQFTRDSWTRPPRFVLLAGDSSYDPKNYLGYGDSDLVPTKLYDSAYMEAASDDWFVDFQGTGLPEIATGRLPVRNVTEAAALVRKILSYENSSSANSALLTADLNDGHNFGAAGVSLRTLLPGDMKVQQVARGTGDDEAVKSELLAAINQGQTIVNYNGHGSSNQWRGGLLTNADAASLTNSHKLALFVIMTCLNGYFDDPVLDSLAESLLNAPGGAAAVWASGAQSEPAPQEALNRELYRLLFGGDSITVGEAAARAKQAVINADVRRSWILFGDPAMKLK